MLPQVAGLYRKYKDQGFHVVGLEVQGSPVAKILQQNKAEGVDFQVTTDGNIKGAKVGGIPHGFLFGADGKLIADDPSHRKLEEMVKTALKEVAAKASIKAAPPAAQADATKDVPKAASPAPRATATAEALAAWDAKLKARVQADLTAKRRTEFLLTSMKMQVAITVLDEKGTMRLLSQGLEVPSQWERLTLEEKRNLAVAFAKTGEQPDLLLAVFYCLAMGAEDQAGKYMALVTQAEALKEVLSAFGKKG